MRLTLSVAGPKSRFTGEGCAQAIQRVTGSVENAFEAGLAFER
jgi:hypothetical protein